MTLFALPQGGNRNDPVMVNPSGVEVTVPQERVMELLDKGFALKDPSWRPIEEKTDVRRTVPKRLDQLQEEVSKELDMLEVTQIL